MGRLHFSSAPKYQKTEPVPEVKLFATWADQEFDPESEELSGLMMVYEAFVDRDGARPLSVSDDADAISELTSDSSSSAATEDEEYPTLRRVPREHIQTPSSPMLSPRVGETGTNEFEDFVRIERPEPDSRPLATHQPNSPLRQSITLDANELPDHPPPDSPEVVLQRGDDERLFNYYQSYERPHFISRVGLESRMASPARRIPGYPRLIPRVEIQRVPLANPPVSDHGHVRPRSASVSDAFGVGVRVPERWLSAVEGTVVSSRILAQR